MLEGKEIQGARRNERIKKRDRHDPIVSYLEDDL